MAELDLTKIANASINTPAAGVVAMFFDTTETVFASKDSAGDVHGIDGSMYAIVEAGDFNLLTTSGVQSCFPTTKDVWTLKASTTYWMKGFYVITKSTTTVTTAIAFAAGGSLSITSMLLECWSFHAAADTTTATLAGTYVDQLASTVVNATSTANVAISFAGLIRVNVAGTLTPQINFSANTTTPVMKANSYIKFTPAGSNTTNIRGNVG